MFHPTCHHGRNFGMLDLILVYKISYIRQKVTHTTKQANETYTHHVVTRLRKRQHQAPVCCVLSVSGSLILWGGAVSNLALVAHTRGRVEVGEMQKIRHSAQNITFTCGHACHRCVSNLNCHLKWLQWTDTGPTSPSTDPRTPGGWQDNH